MTFVFDPSRYAALEWLDLHKCSLKQGEGGPVLVYSDTGTRVWAGENWPDEALEAIDDLYTDAPGLAATAIRQQAEIERMREILTFDVTGHPNMEAEVIAVCAEIAGRKGSRPHPPDPVAMLEYCERIARAALEPQEQPDD